MPTTITPQKIIRPLRKVKGYDRQAMHKHADEYLLKQEQSILSTKAQAKSGSNILLSLAKYFAKGLEIMFSPIVK